MKTSPNAIQNQVRLPLGVAWGVVVQGIRIRLGRSIVTLLGVVLGVAFLMSILSSSLLRGKVGQEVDVRRQLSAMLGFLTAETGALDGRSLVVLRTDLPLDEIEPRFLEQVFRPGAARALDADALGVTEDKDRPSVLLVVGDSLPADTWQRIKPHLRQPVAVFTRAISQDPTGSGISLRRPPTEEDIQRMEAENRRERVRTIWILTIAALVTIISISNALLMSVTERFREIGTMKCLGALSSFIRQIFFLESALIGFVGGVLGSIAGFLFAGVLYGFTYGWVLVFGTLPVLSLLGAMTICLLGGIAASVFAAIYPATVASRMVPATALRTNI